MKRKDDVTIYDIARIAGVSAATVSRVLNNTIYVKDSTRAKVQKVIDQFNFQPNPIAKGLITKETKMIGCLLPDITNPFYNQFFLEAEKAALQYGYTMLLANSDNNADIEFGNLKGIVDKPIDGLIFVGDVIDNQKTQKSSDIFSSISNEIPIVNVNGQLEGPNCYQVHTDEAKGIRSSVEYLYRLGHTEMMLVGGMQGHYSTDIKVKEFKSTLDKLGIAQPENPIMQSNWSLEDGRRCFVKMMQQEVLPTAIIAMNDLIAIGILQEAAKHGIRIPNDISIVGYDNIYWSKIFIPSITTVDQNYTKLAESTINILLDAMAGKEIAQKTTIPTSLIVRDSCSAPINRY